MAQVVEEIVGVIVKRADKGDNFGVILVPEGLIEFVPEMKKLIAELNDMMAHYADEFNALAVADQASWVVKNLVLRVLKHIQTCQRAFKGALYGS